MAYLSPSLSNSHYMHDSDVSSTSSPSPSLESCSLDPASSTAASGTDDVFRAVVRCRKSWKTLKGGKVVWPLHLEAALLEGLSLYQPDNSRETLLLGRFPMRNRFISDHIFKTTGETRTAKQVGSRLQQLRDTCGGGKKCMNDLLKSWFPKLTRCSVQKLLSPVLNSGTPISNRSHYSLRRSGSRSTMGSSSVPTSPISQELELLSSPNVMFIDLVPEGGPSSPVARKYSSDIDVTNVLDSVVSSSGPRRIKDIKPSLAFKSSFDSSIAAQSMFTIYYLDGTYDEDQSFLTPMMDQPAPEGATVYTCDLVPSYWHMICDNPTAFTIDHHIIREPSTSFDAPTTLFSATYKFRYVPEKDYSSPASSFSTLSSDISAFQEADTTNYRQYNHGFSTANIPEMSPSYDSKSWDCFNDLPVGQRGYTSLPNTPNCWDDYGPSSVRSCSSSSSPTTSNFPSQSQFYPL
ncbi:hypothetical protein DFJ43DRAFT_370529 [Lentinula guzmanii]|uniref:TEA domain-containing protein n=1 Tax=Lentinula guzmanii TaxID=2804957 RepID=A0AA38JJG3_9AGAR|nr:hypothetical protein DFJ43DRAFT_370529 [Lentinula guzmanii]